MLANTWYTCILDEITKEMSLDKEVKWLHPGHSDVYRLGDGDLDKSSSRVVV